MKALIITLILASALASSCASESQKTAGNTTAGNTTASESPTPTLTPQVHVTPPVTNTTSETTAAAETGRAPVDFTYVGVTPDKESVSYKIKVNTGRPISQVDLAVRYLDAQGKVVAETTRAWQNIVKSKKQPIEQGKTYEVTDYLDEGATSAEFKLKRVIFADGGYWSAK